jgi:hypothetical protein
MQMVNDVFHQFSTPVLYLCPYYSFTYAPAEERLVIVDQEKLLFVMRIEED